MDFKSKIKGYIKTLLTRLTSPFFATLLLSVIIHMAFTPIIVTALITRGNQITYTPIFFREIPRKIEKTKSKKDQLPPKYNPPEKIPEGQIVDAPIPPKEIKENIDEEKIKFISDKTVRVKKQTRSQARVAGKYDIASKTTAPPSLSGEKNTEGAITPVSPEGMKLKEAEEAELISGQEENQSIETPPGQTIQILPSFKAISNALKGSGLDKLDEVEEGEKTLLNTNQWKYAGFFLRVKNAVAQFWRPGEAFLLYDPTGRAYGYKDRETIVRVVLDCSGKIKHLYITRPSGAKFLDDEALSALKKASPFTNPPAPLCDPEEKIIVFNFGFFVKVGDSPIVKVKRY